MAALREKILGTDILVLSTPTWVSHMSSVVRRALDASCPTPTQGCTYWNGEAMQGGDFNDLDEADARQDHCVGGSLRRARRHTLRRAYPPYE